MDPNAEARCSQCGRPTTRSYEALEAAIAHYRAQGYLLESRGSDWAQLRWKGSSGWFLAIPFLVIPGFLFPSVIGRMLIWLDAEGTVRLDEGQPTRRSVPKAPVPWPRRRWAELSSRERTEMTVVWGLLVVLTVSYVGAVIWWLAPKVLGLP